MTIGKVETRLKKLTSKGPIVAALIDPEDFTPAKAAETASKAVKAGAKLVLVGGSTASDQTRLDHVVKAIKRRVTQCDVVIFPSNVSSVCRYADAILFSSLLNSTNPYFIVGAQALGAMEVFKSGLESIPMGYLVFGSSSATSFIGQVNPLPSSKPGLATIYALAARYLGMRTLYLEAGSGSNETISPQTIELVRRFYDGILIVGGGITSPDKAKKIATAGADILVIGNLLQTMRFEGPLRTITRRL